MRDRRNKPVDQKQENRMDSTYRMNDRKQNRENNNRPIAN